MLSRHSQSMRFLVLFFKKEHAYFPKYNTEACPVSVPNAKRAPSGKSFLVLLHAMAVTSAAPV